MHRFRDIAAGIPDPTFSRTTTGSTGNGYTRESGRVVKTVYPQTPSSAPDPARETHISSPDPWLDLRGLTSKHGVLRYGREGQDTGEKGRINFGGSPSGGTRMSLWGDVAIPLGTDRLLMSLPRRLTELLCSCVLHGTSNFMRR